MSRVHKSRYSVACRSRHGAVRAWVDGVEQKRVFWVDITRGKLLRVVDGAVQMRNGRVRTTLIRGTVTVERE